MTQSEAVKALGDRCEWRRDPVLTEQELMDLVNRHLSVLQFGSGQAYSKNQRVIASTASLTSVGVPVYIVTSPGVTSAEPLWPVSRGYEVASGGVVFRFFGRHTGNPYDLVNAERVAWRLKLSKATDRIHMKGSGQEMDDQQVFEHIERKLKALGPAVFVG